MLLNQWKGNLMVSGSIHGAAKIILVDRLQGIGKIKGIEKYKHTAQEGRS